MCVYVISVPNNSYYFGTNLRYLTLVTLPSKTPWKPFFSDFFWNPVVYPRGYLTASFAITPLQPLEPRQPLWPSFHADECAYL